MFQSEHDLMIEQRNQFLQSQLPAALLPSPPTAQLPVIMSLNAGVGGAEAALWVSDLFRMYSRYAESNGWRMEIVTQIDSSAERGERGMKEVTFKLEPGHSLEREVYGALQWEKGVHRVQRVPITDSSGRVHTSTVAIIVSQPPFEYSCSGHANISRYRRGAPCGPKRSQDRSDALWWRRRTGTRELRTELTASTSTRLNRRSG